MTTVAARSRNFAPPGSSRSELALSPYTQARKEWDARMGSAVIQAKNWRLLSFAVTGLLFASLAGNVYLGKQPKAVPHIVDVDALGAPTYRGPAEALTAHFTPSEPLIRYQVRRFIELTRTVSSDNVLLRKYWVDVYKMLTTGGSTLLTDWVHEHEHNPFERAPKETNSIEILSAVPLSASSWQVDWRETTWTRNGQPSGKPIVWRALLQVVLHAPETAQQIVDNPLGVFIDEFHWDQIQTVR
jgi:type IV secretory pathway TrbF-like protein